MNIFAIHGHKVKVTEETANSGTEEDAQLVKEHLVIGQEYTVDETIINDWSSTVLLVEVPEFEFNTVNFVDVKEQSIEDDMKHPQWSRYN